MTKFENRLDLIDIIERFGRLIRSTQYSEGLNPVQWEALRYIARANQFSKSPSALAEFLNATKGTVSQTLISLEDKGYISRYQNEKDKRAVFLKITKQGHDLLSKDPLLHIKEIIQKIENEKSNPLTNYLNDILLQVGKDCQQNSFGVCDSCFHFVQNSNKKEKITHCGLKLEKIKVEDQDKICVNHTPKNGSPKK